MISFFFLFYYKKSRKLSICLGPALTFLKNIDFVILFFISFVRTSSTSDMTLHSCRPLTWNSAIRVKTSNNWTFSG